MKSKRMAAILATYLMIPLGSVAQAPAGASGAGDPAA